MNIIHEAGMLDCIHRQSQEIKRLRLELERAKRALRSSRCTVDTERRRYRAAVGVVEDIRERYRGQGPSEAAYVAILAMLRVRGADPGVVP